MLLNQAEATKLAESVCLLGRFKRRATSVPLEVEVQRLLHEGGLPPVSRFAVLSGSYIGGRLGWMMH